MFAYYDYIRIDKIYCVNFFLLSLRSIRDIFRFAQDGFFSSFRVKSFSQFYEFTSSLWMTDFYSSLRFFKFCLTILDILFFRSVFLSQYITRPYILMIYFYIQLE